MSLVPVAPVAASGSTGRTGATGAAVLLPAGLRIFPGTRRDVTAEELAAEIERVLARLAAGDYEIVDR